MTAITRNGPALPTTGFEPGPDPTVPLEPPGEPLPEPGDVPVLARIGVGTIGAATGLVGGAAVGLGLNLLINTMNGASHIGLGGFAACALVGGVVGALGIQPSLTSNWRDAETEQYEAEHGGRSTLQFARDTIRTLETHGDKDGTVDLGPSEQDGLHQPYASVETLDKWSSDYGWREYRKPLHEMDANQDRQVTDVEFARYASRWDANRDGKMSPEEQSAFHAAGFTYGGQFS